MYCGNTTLDALLALMLSCVRQVYHLTIFGGDSVFFFGGGVLVHFDMNVIQNSVGWIKYTTAKKIKIDPKTQNLVEFGISSTLKGKNLSKLRFASDGTIVYTGVLSTAIQLILIIAQ